MNPALSSCFKDKEIEVQWLLDLHKMTLLFAQGLEYKPFFALFYSIQNSTVLWAIV